MSVQFLDHTGDVAFEATAATLDELFGEAARALLETITDPATVRPALERRFELAAADLGALLVDWLGELVFVFEVDRQLFADAEVRVSEGEDGPRLAAVARGEVYDPSRHPIRVVVKAVTYHALEVARRPDGTWLARVVLDV